MDEAALRDLIAGKIQKLKQGLRLLQKEQYISNKYGTNSFIDLYAADEMNRHVLVELKRSNAAARQAMHEVTKYVESVKQYFGAKDGEIHVIIASTEWRELLVPFSRFASEAGFSAEGLLLTVDADESDFTAVPVTPLPVTQGRFIAPWHNLYWYTDREALEAGIAGIEDAYGKKGIEDYLVAVFYIPDESTEEGRRDVFRMQVAQMAETDESDLPELPSFPVYEYIAYTALQILPKEVCMEIISKNRQMLSEVEEILADGDWTEEDALSVLHEYVEATEPSPVCDFCETGSPAKFSYVLGMENSRLLKIIRHGLFERNVLLHDDVLCAELAGEDGSTGERFEQTICVENGAHVRELKSSIASALADNPVWRGHILRIIDEVCEDFPHAEMEFHVFNPCMGVFTLYYGVTKENGLLYIPSYYIRVKNPNDVRLYYGVLEWGGRALTFPEILDKYYMGSLEKLLFSVTWGGRETRDSDIIEDLGMQYSSYRMELQDGSRSVSVLCNERWHPAEKHSMEELLEEYCAHNDALITQIVRKIYPKDKGILFTSSNSDTELEKYVNRTMAKQRKCYFAGAPEVCDICKFPLGKEHFFIDGQLRNDKPWAFMCGDCFLAYGDKIEWGHGQLYQRDSHGWLQVGGFSPEDEMAEEQEEN